MFIFLDPILNLSISVSRGLPNLHFDMQLSLTDLRALPLLNS